MSRGMNLEKLPKWYNPYELKALFLHAGYDDYGETAQVVFQVNSPSAARRKINKCTLSHDDTLNLARKLRMSPKEYLEVFCKGVFDEED